MDKKIMSLLDKPLYPYLYGISFISYKSARYLTSFSFFTAFAFFLGVCAVCYVLTTLFKKVSTSSYSGISVVIIIASLFHVATIAQFFGYEYAYIPTQFYVVFYAIVIAGIILLQLLFSRITGSSAFMFNKVANVFLLAISIVFFLNGVLYAQKINTKHSTSIATFRKIPAHRQRDIIWFLLDEYPSAISLKQQFAFDNTMDKQLAAKGFEVLGNMHSRFNNTLYSLNAIFNYDDSVVPASFFVAAHSLQQNSWIKELDDSGYEIVNLGIFDLGMHPKLADRSGYPQTFWQQLITGTFINVVNNGIKFSIAQCDRYTQEILQKLDDTLKSTSDKPRFIWVHLSIPHEPFCRDSKGHVLDNISFEEADSTPIKKGFVEYLQYGNTVMNRILKDHPSIFENIIVVSGDHGPRFRFLHDKAYQKWPLAAVRIPGNYDTTQLRQLRYISQIPSFISQYRNN